MKLIIISPTSKKIFEIRWLELETGAGNMMILEGHAPTLLTLIPHEPLTLCTVQGKQETFMTTGGVVHVQRHEITIMLEE